MYVIFVLTNPRVKLKNILKKYMFMLIKNFKLVSQFFIYLNKRKDMYVTKIVYYNYVFYLKHIYYFIMRKKLKLYIFYFVFNLIGKILIN